MIIFDDFSTIFSGVKEIEKSLPNSSRKRLLPIGSYQVLGVFNNQKNDTRIAALAVLNKEKRKFQIFEILKKLKTVETRLIKDNIEYGTQ